MVDQEVMDQLWGVYVQWEERLRETEDNTEAQYLQGKKDGFRLVMMMLAPSLKDRQTASILAETAPTTPMATGEETEVMDEAIRLNEKGLKVRP